MSAYNNILIKIKGQSCFQGHMNCAQKPMETRREEACPERKGGFTIQRRIQKFSHGTKKKKPPNVQRWSFENRENIHVIPIHDIN